MAPLGGASPPPESRTYLNRNFCIGGGSAEEIFFCRKSIIVFNKYFFACSSTASTILGSEQILSKGLILPGKKKAVYFFCQISVKITLFARFVVVVSDLSVEGPEKLKSAFFAIDGKLLQDYLMASSFGTSSATAFNFVGSAHAQTLSAKSNSLSADSTFCYFLKKYF